MKNSYQLIVIALLFSFTSSLKAQTAGTLIFKVGEVAHATTYSGTKRVLSVWIQGSTNGTTWTFVKTLFQKGRNVPNNHTPTWVTASASNLTGTTTATSSTSSFSWTASSLQTITWDGTNVSSVVVADGNYRVAVEECWDHGGSAVAYFPFTKGATAVSQTPTNASFSNMTLTWTPTLAADTFVKSPEAVVYPIPSKGIFNIDLKSDVKNIQVIDITGKVIYNEEIKETTTSATKQVDLSSFNDGVYFINVSDDTKTSTYKVLLEK
jgi:hypothetical protein